ncbi:hypothetical protein BG004_007310 [Podila humilis]|nr:hypothetical protein BG004_007310 [Podila humilis]
MDGGRDTWNTELFALNKGRFMEKVFDSKHTAWNRRPIVRDSGIADDGSGGGGGGGGGGSTVAEKRGIKDSDESSSSEIINITGRYQQVTKAPIDSVHRRAIRAAGKSVRLYVAGNHDVGFGDTLIREAMVRYKQEFGSVNYQILVGNHSLVIVDTLALSSSIPTIREESQGFITKIGQEEPLAPRILFTHVPLHRPESTYCGDAREATQLILDSGGEQYQNMVNASLSREILTKIQPDMVFSGDDHDWCEVAHSLDGVVTPELTLPTFSFAQGIRQPGFVMLSLFNPEGRVRNKKGDQQHFVPSAAAEGFLPAATPPSPPSWLGGVNTLSDSSTFAYRACMLPNQLAIYNGYIYLLVLTIGYLILTHLDDARRIHTRTPIRSRWEQQHQYHQEKDEGKKATTAKSDDTLTASTRTTTIMAAGAATSTTMMHLLDADHEAVLSDMETHVFGASSSLCSPPPPRSFFSPSANICSSTSVSPILQHEPLFFTHHHASTPATFVDNSGSNGNNNNNNGIGSGAKNVNRISGDEWKKQNTNSGSGCDGGSAWCSTSSPHAAAVSSTDTYHLSPRAVRISVSVSPETNSLSLSPLLRPLRSSPRTTTSSKVPRATAAASTRWTKDENGDDDDRFSIISISNGTDTLLVGPRVFEAPAGPFQQLLDLDLEADGLGPSVKKEHKSMWFKDAPAAGFAYGTQKEN